VGIGFAGIFGNLRVAVILRGSGAVPQAEMGINAPRRRVSGRIVAEVGNCRSAIE
jgi:hypothetical protein